MKTYQYGDLNSHLILIQMIDEYEVSLLENEYNLIKEKVKEDFLLVAYQVNDWNKDLSPYKTKAIFGKDDFGDGAKNTLDIILKDLQKDKTYILGGYSLAGLFAIYSAYQTSIFKGICAVSASLWFPNFINYMEDNNCLCQNIYLSLGNKENKSHNPVLATSLMSMEKAYNILKNKSVNVNFEINEGNHFVDVEKRMAKSFIWAINQLRR